jgi:Flp pilus assembly protein TadG
MGPIRTCPTAYIGTTDPFIASASAAHATETDTELSATTLKMPTTEPRDAPMPASRLARARDRERGQALVEFAGVILPLVLILVGIIQSGFLFSGYVGISNAAREGARAGTIYEYDAAEGQGQNDLLRCQAILAAAQQAVDAGVPGEFSGSCATINGGGDLSITYPDAGTCTNSARTGCQLRVTLTFHQPLLVPLVGAFFSIDEDNTIGLGADVTMVVN